MHCLKYTYTFLSQRLMQIGKLYVHLATCIGVLLCWFDCGFFWVLFCFFQNVLWFQLKIKSFSSPYHFCNNIPSLTCKSPRYLKCWCVFMVLLLGVHAGYLDINSQLYSSPVQSDLMQLLIALSVRMQCLTLWWMPSLEWMSLLVVVLLWILKQ